MVNLLNRTRDNDKVRVAVEYVSPHWVVLIRNPGAKEWVAVRDKTNMIDVQNHFGDVVKSFPAIRPFDTMKAAQEWVKENMPGVETMARKNGQIEEFLQEALKPQLAFS